VEGLRQILDQDENEEEEEDLISVSSPGNDILQSHSTFILSKDLSSPAAEMRSLHPSKDHMEKLLKVYLENVDPVFKVLHRPTLKNLYSRAINNLDDITGGKSMEALLFATYFAAVTTISEKDAQELFGERQIELWTTYRYYIEKALGEADFLISIEIETLQAFTLYVACVRVHDNSRHSWALTGLALRLAQSLNIHQESPPALFTPFQREMRRRLFWTLCTLDVRASEDRGSQPIVTEGLFTTKLPSNINDEDFGPDSQFIVPRTGGTEMTFSLISMEVSNLVRKLYSSPGDEASSEAFTFAERVQLITHFHELLEKKYVNHCDPTVPVLWGASLVYRIVTNRLWLSIHFPFEKRYKSSPMVPVSKAWVLQTAVSVLELTHYLEHNAFVNRWTWLSGTYVQWHSVAITLAELCSQTQGPLVDRSWRVIDAVFSKTEGQVADAKRGGLWRPIQKLYQKASAARKAHQQQASLSQDPTSSRDSIATATVPEDYLKTTQLAQDPASFSGLNLPTGFKSNADMDETARFLELFDPFDVPQPSSASMVITQSPPSNTHPHQQGLVQPMSQMGFESSPFDWSNWNDFVQDSANVDVQAPFGMW
jgi:hypothetical protein